MEGVAKMQHFSSQKPPNLDFLSLTVHACVMQNDVTVSYDDLRDSHRRLVSALREARETEARLNEQIHFLKIALAEQQIGVFPCSPDVADA
jgi:hypothetical protein